MTRRKGAGKGTGRGYKNLPGYPKDPKVHGDSAKGKKQAQKVRSYAELVRSGAIRWDDGKDVVDNRYLTQYERDLLYRNPRNNVGVMISSKSIEVQPGGFFYDKEEGKSESFKSACPTMHKLTEEQKKTVMNKVSATGLRGMKALEYAEKLSREMMQKPREIVKVMRVPYRKSSTPIHLREYQISPGAPVGTIKEYEDLFEGQNVKVDAGLTLAEKKKVTKMAKLKDSDGDGVADILDCQPNNPNKQDDEFEDIDEFEGRVADKPSFGKRLTMLGRRGVKYVSNLNRARVEKREAFESEIQNLSDKQLREIAVRYIDNSLFGSSNPYEDELIRREKERNNISKRLAEEKQRIKEGNGGGFFS